MCFFFQSKSLTQLGRICWITNCLDNTRECWMTELQEEDNGYGAKLASKDPNPTPWEGNNKGCRMNPNNCEFHKKETRKAFLKYTEKKMLNTACYFKYLMKRTLCCATTETSWNLTQAYLGVTCEKNLKKL